MFAFLNLFMPAHPFHQSLLPYGKAKKVLALIGFI